MTKPPTCHPLRPHHAQGYCKRCYNRGVYAGTIQIRAPRRPVDCFVCGRVTKSIRRFKLVLNMTRHGKRTSKGAGSIDLCEACWKHTRRRIRVLEAVA